MHPQEKWRQMSTQKLVHGTSLEVQWLGLCLPIQGGQVWSLVRELGCLCPKGQEVGQKWYCNKFNRDFRNGPHQKKTKTKTGTWMSIAELCTVAKRWKQSKWPPSDEWINKRYIHTIEYYSVVKEMKSWYVLHHGWSLKTWCFVEEANHKKPNIVWFYF